MLFVVLDPRRKPGGLYDSMAAAQAAIAVAEPDIVKQGEYQIHPVDAPEHLDALKLRLVWKIQLEKFDTDGNLVEVIEREGVN